MNEQGVLERLASVRGSGERKSKLYYESRSRDVASSEVEEVALLSVRHLSADQEGRRRRRTRSALPLLLLPQRPPTLLCLLLRSQGRERDEAVKIVMWIPRTSRAGRREESEGGRNEGTVELTHSVSFRKGVS